MSYLLTTQLSTTDLRWLDGTILMGSGKTIELPVETAAHETGNVVPLLHEVHQAIQRQIESGEDTVIDLRSLPMAPGEEARIEEMLGRGEMEVRLINALGLTEIHETSFSGVWWVVYHNQNDAVIGKFIEIARVPSMFNSQTVDMKAARPWI